MHCLPLLLCLALQDPDVRAGDSPAQAVQIQAFQIQEATSQEAASQEAPADELHVHERPAFTLRLPSKEWTLQDQGGAGVVALVFSPDAILTRRFCVLRLPGIHMPDGLETREQQIAQAGGAHYERISFEPGRISGREATRWEYRAGPSITVEWCFADEDQWVIFQVSAPETVWDDPEGRAQLDAGVASFRWTGGEAAPPPVVDPSTPEQVHARRPVPAAASRTFELVRHRIQARIEPDEHSLDAWDRLEIVALEDELDTIDLYTTLVTVDQVEASRPIDWTWEYIPDADRLRVTVDPPLDAGDELVLEVRTTCADFLQRIDQDLVAEIAIVGQIRPESSWSSHVVWYPIDEVNDAAMDMTLDVPAPRIGLTGGELVEDVTDGGRRRTRYVTEQRVNRLVPFGFAVSDDVRAEGESEAGLRLGVWGFAGDEKRIEQRREVLLEAAKAFEHAFGPLPWSDVRFVHVRPEEKETGVSLPGMILVSDFYFPDLEGVDASRGNLADPAVLGLLVVADELSHQWNVYAAGFPNELAEGISTYTNALFVEARHGAEAYRRTIATCCATWISSAGSLTEYAIADPQVYLNSRYRAVVFCKTPVVLDALRRRLGDEVFFAGLRRAFSLRDPLQDGFDLLRQGFEEASGRDLRPFFDQWFFRAGFPELRCDFEPTEDGARITVLQEQPEDPYSLAVELHIECADGSTREIPVMLEGRETALEVELPAAPVKVELGPKGRLPAKVHSGGSGD